MFMIDKEILKFYIKHTKGYRLLYIGLIINDFIMSFEPLVFQKKKKWLIDTLSIDTLFSIGWEVLRRKKFRLVRVRRKYEKTIHKGVCLEVPDVLYACNLSGRRHLRQCVGRKLHR